MIFAHDDEAALDALSAIQDEGRTDIRYIVGFGGNKPAYELLRANDPVFLASISYLPSMGFDAVEMAVRVLRGIPFSKDTIIASQVVGAWNVEDFWNDAY